MQEESNPTISLFDNNKTPSPFDDLTSPPPSSSDVSSNTHIVIHNNGNETHDEDTSLFGSDSTPSAFDEITKSSPSKPTTGEGLTQQTNHKEQTESTFSFFDKMDTSPSPFDFLGDKSSNNNNSVVTTTMMENGSHPSFQHHAKQNPSFVARSEIRPPTSLGNPRTNPFSEALHSGSVGNSSPPQIQLINNSSTLHKSSQNGTSSITQRPQQTIATESTELPDLFTNSGTSIFDSLINPTNTTGKKKEFFFNKF